jgi:tRNA nucleotidyltransferase (CCA-adding enzyme)
MTVKSYLREVSNQGIIRDSDKDLIKRSIDALSSRLERHFGSEITDHLIFGSYKRGTSLPRNMDVNSDVDYMVVFKDENFTPQTYLNRLRRFAEKNYSRSEIKQSHPTILLSLFHTTFELVPAIQENFWGNGYKIPDRAKSYNDWILTNPRSLENKVTSINKTSDYLAKPVVRLFKYWNATNHYPFKPHKLEESVIEYMNPIAFFDLVDYNLEDYVFGFGQSVSAGFFDPEWKRSKISRLKNLSREASNYYERGYEHDALNILKKIFPPL